jgi:predicted kinase
MMKVIVMQAISGGGKTTWIRNNYPEAVVTSADHFFEKTGEYDFVPQKLPEAHGECFRDYIGYISAPGPRTGTVIVDNTGTSIAELAPYCAAALAYGHELEIVSLDCDPKVAHARNVHGVPLAAVMGQYERLQKTLKEMPPWWSVRTVDTNS